MEEADAHEALTEMLVNEMKEAMLTAYEHALAKFQASPGNQMNPEATIMEAKFLMVQAAFAASSQLEGEEEARSAFENVATDSDEPLHFIFPHPAATARDARRAERKKMQKASRKANRR